MFFSFCSVVKAKTDYNYKNICNNKSISSDNKSDCSINGVSSSHTSNQETVVENVPGEVETTPVYPNYNTLFLIDTSDSMKEKGYLKSGSRKDKVNEAVKKFVERISEYDKKNGSSSKISYVFTSDVSKVVTIYDKGRIIKSFAMEIEGKTPLQNIWKKAYDYFNENGYSKTNNRYCGDDSENIPQVILFTDGHPNSYSAVTDVTSSSFSLVPDVQNSSYYTEFSSVYTYNTMKTMLSFINNVCDNVKIYNFGIGMKETDAFANYMLNPSSEKYSRLSDVNQPTTISTQLKKIIDDNSDIVRVYDATATIGGGHSEYGLFAGNLSSDKAKTVIYQTYFDDVSSGRWSDKPKGYLYLSVPILNKSDVSFSDIKQIEYCTGNTCKTIAKKYYPSTIKNNANYPYDTDGHIHHFTVAIMKSGIGSVSPKSVTSIKITFKKEITFSSFNLPKTLNQSQIDSVIKDKVFSYVGSDIEKVLSTMFESVGEQIVKTKNSSRTVTRPISVTTHTSSCNESSANVSAYIKIEENGYDANNKTKSIGNCVPVVAAVDIVLTEELKLIPNKPKGEIYAGGGFSWKGPQLNSKIRWYYKFLSDKNPLFKLKANYVLAKPNGAKYFPSLDGFYKIDEVYKDGSCSTRYSFNEFEKEVWGQLKNNKIKKNVEFNITSVHYNDVTKIVAAPLLPPVVKYNTNDVVLDSDNSNQFYNVEISSSLKHAYICNGSGDVVYENASGISKEGCTEHGQYYHVPLKYNGNKGKFIIKFNASNYSLIGGKFEFSNECSIFVKNVMRYRYRSIDVSNPFPKTNNSVEQIVKEYGAENWAYWYQDRGHQNRIKDTYNTNKYPNSPLYSVTINASNIPNTI